MKNKVKVRYFNQRGHRYNCSSFKNVIHGYYKNKYNLHRWPVYTHLTISNNVDGVRWWFDSENKWYSWSDAVKLGLFGENSLGCSSHCSKNTFSVKAAIRHAKKHIELPVGTILILCSNLDNVGVEIRIIGKENQRYKCEKNNQYSKCSKAAYENPAGCWI